jgi:hypothetical protein
MAPWRYLQNCELGLLNMTDKVTLTAQPLETRSDK